MAILFESLLLDIGAFTAFLLAFVYMYFRSSYTYWKRRNVPHVEPTFPTGNFADNLLLRKSLGAVFTDLYRKLEGEKYGGTYMFAKPGFLFRDPELIRSVLVKDFSHFHDRGIYVNEKVDPLSGHLFFLSGTRWRNLRIKLSPTFTSGKMKMMFHTLVECGEELRNCLQETARKEEILEIKDILARYSTDVIASCAFGVQCNCLKNPDAEFRQWGRKVFTPTIKSSISAVLAFLLPELLDIFNISRLDKNISKYFRNMVTETIDCREKNNVKRNDFMQLLIELKNKGYVEPDHKTQTENVHTGMEKPSDSSEFSMDNLAAQAFVFFLAGFETSSTTMTFCLYELSVNPDIQERVRTEIRTVLQKHDGKITYESINEMSYLDKVVSETLRKYPPAPTLNRVCTKEYRIPGTDVVIQEGMPTVIPVLAIHRDPKYYPDPERFNPERFSEEEKGKRHPYVYLPFGEGPRICIGMRFGLMQTKVGLASLLSKYQFSVSEKTPVPLVLSKRFFILAPEGGMWLRIKQCK